MIDLRDLSYRYPGSTCAALRDIDWEVDEGEFAVVAGPSGGGKSTLLRCLNGLIPHLSGGHFGGTAVVGGHDITRYGPRTLSRVTGFVFQDPDGQAVAATVEDEIAFSMEQLGVSVPIMRKRVEEMLDLLGVAQLRDRAVPTLSGGERQRVAIAAALAQQTPLLLLDEPASALDLAHQVALMRLIARLCGAGRTVLMAAHDLNMVDGVASHALLLSGQGRWRAGTMDAMMQPDLLKECLGHPISVLRHEGRRIYLPQDGVGAS
jgi:energy-coupling factor transporter ATP-binding protein EcfA2